METITYGIAEFPNTKAAVENYVKSLSDTYKGLLIRDDKKASGNLIRSVKPLPAAEEESRITGSMELASYWKYIEFGRRPGKWPPMEKILRWIIEKPVIPRPDKKGRVPTEKQLSFLISRKIGLEGIKPGNQLEEAVRMVWPSAETTLSEAISKDLDTEIGKLTVIR